MKKAWNDLKSFVTVSMIVILFLIVVANLFGASLSDNLLILVTNLTTAVFTYYFTRMDDKNNSVIRERGNNDNSV